MNWHAPRWPISAIGLQEVMDLHMAIGEIGPIFNGPTLINRDSKEPAIDVRFLEIFVVSREVLNAPKVIHECPTFPCRNVVHHIKHVGINQQPVLPPIPPGRAFSSVTQRGDSCNQSSWPVRADAPRVPSG